MDRGLRVLIAFTSHGRAGLEIAAGFVPRAAPLLDSGASPTTRVRR